MPKENLNKGRGAQHNQTSRFHANKIERDPDADSPGDTLPRTEFLVDSARSVVNENKSPDVGFRYSVNPYRGCEHGCSYCYARPTHEYFGFSAGLDFESKILVKEKAPLLLREKLLSKNWVPETIFMSGVTDCYQPAERKYRLTRQCLEVLAQFRNPVFLITKNALITRDIDILSDMAADSCAGAFLSVTTLRADLGRVMEPRTSSPAARLRAIEQLASAGVQVGVNVAPIIPGLTDHELPAILKAAKDAGATLAGFTPVRLPYSVKDIFSEWLEAHFPDRKNKVLNAVRAIRGGELNDSNFGSRMRGEGIEAENIRKMFKIFTKKFGLNEKDVELSTKHFRRPGEQLALF